MALEDGDRFMVLAPIVRGRKGEYGRQLAELRSEGFTRVKVDGELRLLEDEIVLDKKYKHDISVVVDRLVMRRDLRKRLADSVETAVALADGMVEIESVPRDDSQVTVTTYSERFACLHCGISMPELEPRSFSFNSPHGACPRCTGLGSQMEIDPELVVPDPSLSLNEGAILPWSSGATSYYEQMTQAIAERYEVDVDAPWEELTEDQQNLFLYGTNGDKLYVSYRNRMGRKRSYMTTFEGIIPNLERRYRETDSDWSREKIEEYMSVRPCPECKGARLRPESRAVKVGGIPIHEYTAMSARRALEWVEALALSDQDRAIAKLILREITERLAFLDNVGVGYLSMDARVGDAVGRRGAADPAGDADRLVAGGRALHPRRAVDRPAPARQRAPDRDAQAPARPRQHRARGRARRGDDARGRPPGRHGAGRRRARRARGRRGHRRGGHAGPGVADGPVPVRHAQHRRCRRSGASRPGTSRSRAPRSTTSRRST